ncbi:transposase [Arthrobacter sp. StoSoilB22]|nr:transposase [Arthrobacter sp. StoSoilB22]
MPTAYGAEFRQDVIDVARKGEDPLGQIAKDFGLSVTMLKRWIVIDEPKKSGAGPAGDDSAEMRELKKRNRLLEQENEILRRAAAYLARDISPNDSSTGSVKP